MQARDVMTKRVLSVTPDTNVRQAATFLVEHGISAAPVLDAKGVLVGLVSEGDLFRRAETGTAKRRSWWLSLLSSNEIEAREFTKANALQVKDLMTRGVVTVGEETEIGEIADLLERKQIKRVPVVKDGRVVGIVSRANLVRALADLTPPAKEVLVDRELRAAIEQRLASQSWAPHALVNIAVHDGHVELTGLAENESQRTAVRVLVEGVPGVLSVKESLSVYPQSAGLGARRAKRRRASPRGEPLQMGDQPGCRGVASMRARFALDEG